MARALLRFVLAVCMAMLMAGLGAANSHDAEHDEGHARVLKVMTRNMDEGTDFGPIFSATTFDQFAAEVAAAYIEVQQSNIPERSLRAKLIGQTPAALTFSGLWPSDHAGVIARFKLKT